MNKIDLIDSNFTLDELFKWLKDEIKKGNLPQFKDKSDEELFELVKVARPSIEIELKLANAFAWEQINSPKSSK